MASPADPGRNRRAAVGGRRRAGAIGARRRRAASCATTSAARIASRRSRCTRCSSCTIAARATCPRRSRPTCAPTIDAVGGVGRAVLVRRVPAHRSPIPTAFYALGIAPFDELGALEINPSVAFAMIDRMLGGAGQPIAGQPAAHRDRTERRRLGRQAAARRPRRSLEAGHEPHVQHPRPRNAAADAAGRRAERNRRRRRVRREGRRGPRHASTSAFPTNVVETAGAQFAQAWPQQRRERQRAGARVDRREPRARPGAGHAADSHQAAGARGAGARSRAKCCRCRSPADQPLDVYVGGLRKLTGRLASEHGRLMVLGRRPRWPTACRRSWRKRDVADS